MSFNLLKLSNTVLIRRGLFLMNTRSKSTSNFEVVNSTKDKTFSVNFGDAEGTVEYKQKGNVYTLTESYIPEKSRGKGYGNILAKNVFGYIASNNGKMKIECTFLMKVYEENKSLYEHIVVDK